MPGDDPAHVGQAHAIALELFLAVQALEYAEQLVGVVGIKAYPVVPHEDAPVVRAFFNSDLNDCLGAWGGVSQGIGEQIFHDLPEQAEVTHHQGQRAEIPLVKTQRRE